MELGMNWEKSIYRFEGQSREQNKTNEKTRKRDKNQIDKKR